MIEARPQKVMTSTEESFVAWRKNPKIFATCDTPDGRVRADDRGGYSHRPDAGRRVHPRRRCNAAFDMPALPGAQAHKMRNPSAEGVWSDYKARSVDCYRAASPSSCVLHDDIVTIHAKYLASGVARLENEAWLFIAPVQLLIRREWRELIATFPTWRFARLRAHGDHLGDSRLSEHLGAEQAVRRAAGDKHKAGE